MQDILARYNMQDWRCTEIQAHRGGRNRTFLCGNERGEQLVLRVSTLPDRTYEDFRAETEFIRYLADGGAPVADVVASVRGNLVERVETAAGTAYGSVFTYAKGDLISDHGYRYIDGQPLGKYHFDTGKALGRIHALSKRYVPAVKRRDYTTFLSPEHAAQWIPAAYAQLKRRIIELLGEFEGMERNDGNYGLVHFDFSDGNYHIDYTNGNITAYDFDNCCYCWYMYDLANLWLHGEGWLYGISDERERAAAMRAYFNAVVQGYRTETDLGEDDLRKLPQFIDLVCIEGLLDEFDVCRRQGATPDPEDIEDDMRVLCDHIPYAGIVSGRIYEELC